MTQRISRLTTLAVAALLATFVLAGVAAGQAIDVPAMLTAPGEENTWAQGNYSHQFNTNVEEGGHFSKSSVVAGGGHRFRLGDDWSLITNAVYKGNYYEFSDGGKLLGYQWKDVHEMALIALVGWQMNDRWTLLGGGIFKLAAEGGADVGDSLTGGGLGGFSYKHSDTLSYGLLIGASSTIEGGAAILPVPMVDWKFADDWRFNLGLVHAGDVGVGPEITWSVSDELKLGCGASYQSRRFRMRDHTGNNDGVGQETGMPVFVRATWMPSNTVAFNVFGGLTLLGEVRAGDEDGNKIEKENYSAAPILGIRGTFRF